MSGKGDPDDELAFEVYDDERTLIEPHVKWASTSYLLDGVADAPTPRAARRALAGNYRSAAAHFEAAAQALRGRAAAFEQRAERCRRGEIEKKTLTK